MAMDPPPFDRRSKGIEPVHLDAAMAVWTYCEESVQMLFKSQSGTHLGDKLVTLIGSNGPMTKDQMNDHLSPKQKKGVDAELARLEAAGTLVRTKEKKPGAGRPATVWKIAK